MSDKKIKKQLLKSGFLVDYAEHLTEEELQWWRDMCEAAYRETLKRVGAELIESDSRNMYYLNKGFWQTLCKEVSNGR